jgi:hypothetical protein
LRASSFPSSVDSSARLLVTAESDPRIAANRTNVIEGPPHVASQERRYRELVTMPGVTTLHFRERRCMERWDFEGHEQNVTLTRSLLEREVDDRGERPDGCPRRRRASSTQLRSGRPRSPSLVR